jgi:molybdopterin synthase sulfur carrier subunit
MARIRFTKTLRPHVDIAETQRAGSTVGQVLYALFSGNDKLRGYILDERGEIRRHMVIFVDGKPVRDRVTLTDPVNDTSEIYIMQALSGG